MTTDLEKRAGAVLAADNLTSFELTALITEVEAGIVAADQQAEHERERALDPMLSPDLSQARQSMEDAQFAANRLRTLLPRLQTQHKKAADFEYLKQWLADYDVLKMERDALAKEFTEFYLEVECKLPSLLRRIEAQKNELSALHQRRQAGVALHLECAELHARGLDRFTVREPSILDELILPRLYNAGDAWPPPKPRADLTLLVAPALNHDPRRYTGDWWQVAEEEQRALKEKDDHEIAEQEARAREQWHGLLWHEGQRPGPERLG